MRALILMLALFKNDDQPATVSELAHRGIVGITAAIGGVGVSLAEIEAWMRLGSLAIGMAVGIASFVSIVLSIRRKGK